MIQSDTQYRVLDMDYFLQQMFNCCLVNIKDMLDNGTVINGKMVESPKSFQVACTVLTQIIAQVASNQYGGQTVNVKHLGKYLARSRKRYEKMLGETATKEIVDTLLQKELESGVQTIQYQINTLMTTNGLQKLAIVKTGEPYQGCVAFSHANGETSARNGGGNTVPSFNIAYHSTI